MDVKAVMISLCDNKISFV